MMSADTMRKSVPRVTPSGAFPGPSTTPARQTKNRLGGWPLVFLLAATVAGLTLAVHWPVLGTKALNFDDQMYLTENYLVQNPGWPSARRFLTEVLEPSTVKGYYQPLTMISLMLDCAQGGTPSNLRPFHRTSLLLHVVNTVLVIVLLYQLFGRTWIAAAVGLLFGLHPMTVEPLAWVGDRKTLLSAVFALGSLIAYVRYARRPGWRSWHAYSLSAVVFAAALLSKPTATLLPLAMVLLDFWPLGRIGASLLPAEESHRVCFGSVKIALARLIRLSLEKLPFFALAGVSAVITCISQGRTAEIAYASHRTLGHIVLVLCYNIVFYPVTMLWPANLTSHYPYPLPMTLANPVLLASVLGTVVLLVLLAISLRWTRALATGWLLFFLLILPTMGVIGFTNVPASDKYAYLPVIGLLCVLAWGLDRLWARLNSGADQAVQESNSRVKAKRAEREQRRHVGVVQRRRATSVGAMAVVLLMICGGEAAVTRNYLTCWRTSETLYEHMLTLAPNSASVHEGLAVIFLRSDRSPEAMEHYNRAIQLEPDFAEAYIGRGMVEAGVGHFCEAVNDYRKALQLKPNSPEARANLGTALAQSGSTDEACREFELALAAQPENPTIHYNYGIVLAMNRRFEQALDQFRTAIRTKPRDAKCHYNVGLTLANLGRFEEAIAAYTQALQLDPTNVVTMNNIGNAYAAQKKFDQAIGWYKRALQLQPRYAQAHSNLGLALIASNRIPDAVTHFEQAAALEPGNVLSQRRLNAARGLLAPSVADGQQAVPRHLLSLPHLEFRN